MCMTRSDLDAAELELRYHDSAVMPAHWWWAAKGEWKLWIVVLQQRQRQVDDVLPSPFAGD
jgi:hypothetical protein